MRRYISLYTPFHTALNEKNYNTMTPGHAIKANALKSLFACQLEANNEIKQNNLQSHLDFHLNEKALLSSMEPQSHPGMIVIAAPS